MTPAERRALIAKRIGLIVVRPAATAPVAAPAPAAPRKIRRTKPVRLCACGCCAVLNEQYLSTYLPGHRSDAASAHDYCLCGCGKSIPEGRRYRYLPGHRQKGKS